MDTLTTKSYTNIFLVVIICKSKLFLKLVCHALSCFLNFTTVTLITSLTYVA